MEDHRKGRTKGRSMAGSRTAPPHCLTFQEGTMCSWLVNNMGLNCTGPLPCRLFSINTVECIFSHHFLFYSLLYYVNTAYNVYNIQNTCSSAVCYWQSFLSIAGYWELTLWGDKSYMWISDCAWAGAPNQCWSRVNCIWWTHGDACSLPFLPLFKCEF